jgi:hypothetical protein
MADVTPEDAYALTLIAQQPERNRDLVETLSQVARPIGDGLVGEAHSTDPEISEAVESLRAWARKATNQ